jgi:hypothetical protein
MPPLPPPQAVMNVMAKIERRRVVKRMAHSFTMNEFGIRSVRKVSDSVTSGLLKISGTKAK